MHRGMQGMTLMIPSYELLDDQSGSENTSTSIMCKCISWKEKYNISVCAYMQQGIQ